jgi:hypothetical protein
MWTELRLGRVPFYWKLTVGRPDRIANWREVPAGDSNQNCLNSGQLLSELWVFGRPVRGRVGW